MKKQHQAFLHGFVIGMAKAHVLGGAMCIMIFAPSKVGVFTGAVLMLIGIGVLIGMKRRQAL